MDQLVKRLSCKNKDLSLDAQLLRKKAGMVEHICNFSTGGGGWRQGDCWSLLTATLGKSISSKFTETLSQRIKSNRGRHPYITGLWPLK